MEENGNVRKIECISLVLCFESCLDLTPDSIRCEVCNMKNHFFVFQQ